LPNVHGVSSSAAEPIKLMIAAVAAPFGFNAKQVRASIEPLFRHRWIPWTADVLLESRSSRARLAARDHRTCSDKEIFPYLLSLDALRKALMSHITARTPTNWVATTSNTATTTIKQTITAPM